MSRDNGTDSFLSADNLCGQHMLKLASRGSAITSELMRLSEHVPSIFTREGTQFVNNKFQTAGNSSHIHEVRNLICDFAYFKNQDAFETFVSGSPERIELDEKLRETHLPLLERFYALFDSIYGYAQELNRFVQDITEGVYISQTFESILINSDGKQLLSECFYLYGVMLLLMETKFDGRVRERLLVSYLRYKGQEEVNPKVYQMCAATAYSSTSKRSPPGYPEDFFARVPIPTHVISMIVGRMRNDDIYNMVYYYPAPEHRSTALNQQAAMLYVLLFFLPDVLHNQAQVMREIVYKHFNDNWIICWYMGFPADLTYSWQEYRCAYMALQEAITQEVVVHTTQQKVIALKELNPNLEQILREGILTEQYVLDNIYVNLLPLVRTSNVTLRWFVLHGTSKAGVIRTNDEWKKYHEFVASSYDREAILSLLLNSAQLEYSLRTMFEDLIKTKRQRWNQAKEKSCKKMMVLATYFSGEHALSDGVKETQLQEWFDEIAERINELSYKNSTTAGRKIQKLIDALTDVMEFHQVNSNMQVVQFLTETKDLLRQMVRFVNIERKVLNTIMTVGDLSYAWEFMHTHDCFVKELQSKIRKKPHLVLQMRSTFLKLATMLELPLTRIAQAGASDPQWAEAMSSVSEYYSSQLVSFLRKVLHIIPISIFEKLSDIIRIQSQMKRCDTRIPKDCLKSISQLELRKQYALLTCEIAKFADGILVMERTLMGVIQIDPQKLLEEGIRRELVNSLSHKLKEMFIYPLDQNKKGANILTAADLDASVESLSKLLKGAKDSLEYIQDYVGIYGCKMWQEEFTRIINFNVDMECNQYMLQYISHKQSPHQSDIIPIPYFEPTEDVYGFLGRLMKSLLRLTNPRFVFYVHQRSGWYEYCSVKHAAREVVGPRTFTRIHMSISTQGFRGLDRLFSFLIARDLKRFLKILHHSIARSKNMLADFIKAVTPFDALPHPQALNILNDRNFTSLFELAEYLNAVGNSQLFRERIADELRFSVKLHSNTLYSCVNTMNDSILTDVHSHYKDPIESPYPSEAISVLTPYVESCGISQPNTKIYITSEPIKELPYILFIQTVVVLPRFVYEPRVNNLVPSRRELFSIDAICFVFGITTCLQQFHLSTRATYFSLISQYLRVMLVNFENSEKKGLPEVLPPEILILLYLMELFAWVCRCSIEELLPNAPLDLLVHFRSMCSSQKKTIIITLL